jgi:hypothetical protein
LQEALKEMGTTSLQGLREMEQSTPVIQMVRLTQRLALQIQMILMMALAIIVHSLGIKKGLINYLMDRSFGTLRATQSNG